MSASALKLPSNKLAATLWYRFLQLALREDLAVNWDVYRSWGTKDEILRTPFNTWWKARGHQLFATQQRLELVKKETDALLVRIPYAMSSGAARSELAVMLKLNRPRGAVRTGGRFTPTGMIKFNVLNQYQRLLSIRLSERATRHPETEEPPITDALHKLERLYEKNAARISKQRATLIDRGKKHLATKFSARRAQELRSKREREGAIDPKKAYRWLQQAELVMHNVARGEFPGTNYYRRKGGTSIGTMLKKLRNPT